MERKVLCPVWCRGDPLTLSLYHRDEGSYSTVQLVLRTPTGGVAAPQATYYVPATVLLSVRT